MATKKKITKKVAIDQVDSQKSSEKKDITFFDLFHVFLDGYGKNGTQAKKDEFNPLLQKFLKQEITKHECADDFNILILFDNTILVKGDSDKIYEAVTAFNNDKPLLLILLSGGGESGSAYLIGKLCSEFSNKKFVTVVPRYAKSAATLLACAADEIHMGSMSELGPIDPQLKSEVSGLRVPALGLKNSIEHIASLVKKYPDSATMFAQYLNLSVEPVQVGYYERVAESAMQYAERLLSPRSNKLARTPKEIASRLVYEYKDHGFVIDKNEAMDIFGDKIVKCDTKEYELGNAVYNALSEVEEMARYLNHSFYFIGSLDMKPNLTKKDA